MLKWLMLCGLILLFSFAAAAQDLTASLNESAPAAPAPVTAIAPAADPAPAAPISFHPQDRNAWELGIGYEYQRFNVFGLKFHENGFHTDVIRYFTNTFGLEGSVALGFGGNTGPSPFLNPTVKNLGVTSVFLGGGPHLAASGAHKIEPFMHALFGLERLRFPQYGLLTTGPGAGASLGSDTAFAWMGGGGFDFKLWPRLTLRVQADYLGTHFYSKMQNNFSVGQSFVFNF